jgi:nitroimidazol reductase NimA-like FMN-containing flavoprotein (pyridoxamine 5'-phosphate oxidase superfamily)
VRETSQLSSAAQYSCLSNTRNFCGTFVALERSGGIAVMRVLSDAEAFEVINAGRVGRLGCIDNDEPYVVPINYLVDEGSIYSHSLPGKKIDAMRARPRTCLQVDHIDDDFHWRSAIAFGRFEEIDRPKDRREILRKLLYRFPKLTPVESRIVHDAAAPDSVVFRIVVDRVTGVEEE